MAAESYLFMRRMYMKCCISERKPHVAAASEDIQQSPETHAKWRLFLIGPVISARNPAYSIVARKLAGAPRLVHFEQERPARATGARGPPKCMKLSWAFPEVLPAGELARWRMRAAWRSNVEAARVNHLAEGGTAMCIADDEGHPQASLVGNLEIMAMELRPAAWGRRMPGRRRGRR